MNRVLSRNSLHQRLGAIFWGTVVLACVVGLARLDPATRQTVRASVWPDTTFSGDGWGRRKVIDIVDPTGWLKPGDSVFTLDEANSQWRQVGFVVGSERLERDALATGKSSPGKQRQQNPASDSSYVVSLRLNGIHQPAESLDFRIHYASGDVNAVVATLVPEVKRRRLMEKIRLAMRQHGEAITDAMLPVVLDAFRQSVPAIETELKRSMNRHQSEIDALITRYRRVVVQERLVPLAQDQVLPVLLRHGRGPAEEIGREIWDRAPLWQLGWRAAYDQSPLPKRDMLRAAWQRFVDEEVVPILRTHTDQIVAAIEKMMVELSANETIRGEFSQLARQIARDPEVRSLAREIIREAIVENRDLQGIWARTWTSPQAREAFRVAGRRIEPMLREIGDEVMGTRTGGIQPGFARVLRNQILGKDRVWLTVHSGGPRPVTQPIVASVDRGFAVYPIVRLARPAD